MCCQSTMLAAAVRRAGSIAKEEVDSRAGTDSATDPGGLPAPAVAVRLGRPSHPAQRHLRRLRACGYPPRYTGGSKVLSVVRQAEGGQVPRGDPGRDSPAPASSLGTQPVLIGRADDSTLVLTDDYASTRHARLSPRGGDWYVEDLGSTNGTYLDRAKVTTAVRVPLGTPVRVGKTVIELRP